jgi:hypothetical protein
MVAAFSLGGVVCAVLFVGIWRHTGAEGDRARTAQLAEHRQLRASQRRLATPESQLARGGPRAHEGTEARDSVDRGAGSDPRC